MCVRKCVAQFFLNHKTVNGYFVTESVAEVDKSNENGEKKSLNRFVNYHQMREQ